jgi:hypothetical protein
MPMNMLVTILLLLTNEQPMHVRPKNELSLWLTNRSPTFSVQPPRLCWQSYRLGVYSSGLGIFLGIFLFVFRDLFP